MQAFPIPLLKNEDWLHFRMFCPQVENILSLKKWGLSPFYGVRLYHNMISTGQNEAQNLT